LAVTFDFPFGKSYLFCQTWGFQLSKPGSYFPSGFEFLFLSPPGFNTVNFLAVHKALVFHLGFSISVPYFSCEPVGTLFTLWDLWERIMGLEQGTSRCGQHW